MVSGFRVFLASLSAILIFLSSSATAQLGSVFRVASFPSNPPWEFIDREGEFHGFEVDIVNEVAARMGMRASFRGFDFQTLFVLTALNYADLAISTFAITDEILETHSFTQPYYRGKLGIMVRRDSGFERIFDADVRRIGAGAGTYSEEWIEENKEEIGHAVYRSYDRMQGMLEDLQNGELDVAMHDIVSLRYALRSYPDLEIVDAVTLDEVFAIMTPKDAPYLEAVNAHISDMKRDGTMASLYEKWFGEKPAAQSLTLTPLPLPRREPRIDEAISLGDGKGRI